MQLKARASTEESQRKTTSDQDLWTSKIQHWSFYFCFPISNISIVHPKLHATLASHTWHSNLLLTRMKANRRFMEVVHVLCRSLITRSSKFQHPPTHRIALVSLVRQSINFPFKWASMKLDFARFVIHCEQTAFIRLIWSSAVGSAQLLIMLRHTETNLRK